MCLILDTNKYGDFLNHKPDMEPVRKWVEGKGRIAYSPTKKFEEELNRAPNMKMKFIEYRQANRIKDIPKEKVEKMEKTLSNLKSDDPHIIALALVANVKLLVSADKNLQKDFMSIIGGRVYDKGISGYKKLLEKHKCP